MKSTSLRHLLQWQAARSPEGIIAIDLQGREWRSEEFLEWVYSIATHLDGVRGRVLVHAPQDLRALAALYAVWQHGATPVLVGTAYGIAEVVERARTAGCSAVLRFEEAAVVVERCEGWTPAEVSDDEGLVIFTSGTTGRPKGALISMGALAFATSARGLLFEERSYPSAARLDDSEPTPLSSMMRQVNPVFHSISHLAAILNLVDSVHKGVPVVVPGKFSVEALCSICSSYEVRGLRLTPSMVFDLATTRRSVTLSAISSIGCGTAGLAEHVREAFEARYGIPVVAAYGSTETISVATEAYMIDTISQRVPGSTGPVLPWVETRLIDVDGQDSGPVGSGRLAVRSPTLFDGYLVDGRLNRPFEDGWFLTNDIVSIGVEGVLSYISRADDVINCGGFNVFPSRIEAALGRLPGVLDALVAGVPDERLGQVPVAVAVVAPGATTGVEDLKAGLRGELAAYEVPRQMAIVGELPLNGAGKADRRFLAEWWRARKACETTDLPPGVV